MRSPLLASAFSMFVALLAGSSVAQAATYSVGPARTHKQLSAVAPMLQPGDRVELDGDATYAGGVVFDVAGSAAQPITIVGIAVNGRRPVISGGRNTIEARANHYVFESLDITGGTARCFYHHADQVTLRDSVVHDCPAQGILGGDYDTGSFLLERTEVHHCGGGTQDHQIYMSSDEVAFPNAVFRMQGCYVHDGNGGNNIKSRAGRNEIYSNWIEGATYHEVELIGSETSPADAVREDSDVVGNVLVKRNTFFVVRFGGDGTGESKGRYRFVNNTVVTMPGGSAVFRLMDGIESLEVHNNVFAARSGTLTWLSDTDAAWVTGSAVIAGRNNWIQSGALKVSAGVVDSVSGTSPGFASLAADDLRPSVGSALVDSGVDTGAVAGPPGFAFPNPLAVANSHPPLRAASTTIEGRVAVGVMDIGAYELGGAGPPAPSSSPSPSPSPPAEGPGSSVDGGIGNGPGVGSSPPIAPGGATPAASSSAPVASPKNPSRLSTESDYGCSASPTTTPALLELLLGLVVIGAIRRRHRHPS